MGRDPAEAERLRRLTGPLERALADLGRAARAASARLARGPLPGAFRSRFATARGLEPEPPRAFGPDDDPAQLDFGRLGTAFGRNPAWSAVQGELHALQATAYVESEFILVIDLSRSLLTGCHISGDGPARVRAPKLAALYFGVGAFLALAESAGFALRVLYAQGGRVSGDRTRTPSDLAPRVLATIGDRLGRAYRASLLDPSATEPFALAAGLAEAGALRLSGVVIVVSDFLDPLRADELPRGQPPYTATLGELMARHAVVLADVASPIDLCYPEPRWTSSHARKAPRSEGARHPELGTEPRPLPREAILDWNARRREDRRRLRRAVAAGGGRLVRFWGLGPIGCYERALACLRDLR